MIAMSIAAIEFKTKNEYAAKIYQAGKYDSIDFNNSRPSLFGSNFTEYPAKKGYEKSVIAVQQSLDGKYILRLTETKRYTLRVDGENAVLPQFRNENNKLLHVDRDKDSLTFQFVNYLGRARLIFGDGDNFEELLFEVVPDKFDYEDDYITLTEQLAEHCSELLLEYSGATSSIFRQSDEEAKTPLEQFVFLRQFCYSQNLSALLAAIKRNPDRLLTEETELRPFGAALPSKKFYTAPFSHSRNWHRTEAGGFAGYIPSEIATTRKRDSLDTPANRFIKYALQRFDNICLDLLEKLDDGSGKKQASCLAEAQALHYIIDEILQDSFFDDVGKLSIMPQNNQVLQKREGYAQIFHAFSMADMALQLDWKGNDDVYEGEAKNVALLYEYWLFFELFRIILSIDDCQPVQSGDRPFITNTDGGVTISLREGRESCQSFIIPSLRTKINLYYNRTFSKREFSDTRYEGSYSRPFRPDYTLAVFPDWFAKGRNNGEQSAVEAGTVNYIHFDAKYRVSDITSLIGENNSVTEKDELDEDKTASIINTYKRGDLLKMHTYNDAVRRTIGSYVLYPGIMTDNNTKFCMYDEILPGVGAFAIRPSNREQAAAELRKFIYDLLRLKASNHSRLARMSYFDDMVIQEPKAASPEIVNLQPADPGKSDDDWCVMGYIKEDYYRHLKENNLLSTGSEFVFYFYAIKGKSVYPHHKDIFSLKQFCFYRNDISYNNSYKPEGILCTIEKHELISKAGLASLLETLGYTGRRKAGADFYYVLSLRVADDNYPIPELSAAAVNDINGNDAFSPHSPKIIRLSDYIANNVNPDMR